MTPQDEIIKALQTELLNVNKESGRKDLQHGFIMYMFGAASAIVAYVVWYVLQ